MYVGSLSCHTAPRDILTYEFCVKLWIWTQSLDMIFTDTYIPRLDVVLLILSDPEIGGIGALVQNFGKGMEVLYVPLVLASSDSFVGIILASSYSS